MFATLAAAITELDPPVHRDALVELLAERDRLDAKIAALAAAFHGDKQWELDRAVSFAGWLETHGRQSRPAARKLVRTVERLARLPEVASAWQRGWLCGATVDAVVTQVTDALVEVLNEQAEDVVPRLAQLTARHAGTYLRHWRAHAEALIDPALVEDPEERLHHSPVADQWVTRATWGEESGHVIDKALELATSRDQPGQARTPAQRRAEAMVTVAQFFVDHHDTTFASRSLPHLIVTATPEQLANGLPGRYLDTGRPAAAASIERLACDAAWHRLLIEAPSAKLDFGRGTRDISPHLFTALIARDQHCRTDPDCDVPANRCHVHHVTWWEHDGETSLDNVVLSCRRHHRLAHTQRWDMKLKPDGELVIAHPDGRVVRTHPPGTLGA